MTSDLERLRFELRITQRQLEAMEAAYGRAERRHARMESALDRMRRARTVWKRAAKRSHSRERHLQALSDMRGEYLENSYQRNDQLHRLVEELLGEQSALREAV